MSRQRANELELSENELVIARSELDALHDDGVVVGVDRLVGFDGAPLKDVSHAGARYFTRKEIERILRTEVR